MNKLTEQGHDIWKNYLWLQAYSSGIGHHIREPLHTPTLDYYFQSVTIQHTLKDSINKSRRQFNY